MVLREGKLHKPVPRGSLKDAYPWREEGWEPMPTGLLCEIATIQTLHRFGFHGFFKPSIEEVVAQLPGRLVGKVDAFLVEGPVTLVDVMRDAEVYADRGYHLAATRLYQWVTNLR